MDLVCSKYDRIQIPIAAASDKDAAGIEACVSKVVD